MKDDKSSENIKDTAKKTSAKKVAAPKVKKKVTAAKKTVKKTEAKVEKKVDKVENLSIPDTLNVESLENESTPTKNTPETPTKSRMEVLQEKCVALGLPFTEKHTEQDLEQLVAAMEAFTNTGAVPSANGIQAGEANKSIEVNLDNVDAVSSEAPAATNTRFEEKEIIPKEIPNVVITSNLIGFRDMFMGAINGHWRQMSFEEIAALFVGGQYPFSHQINRNPANQNQVEIYFVSQTEKLRLPSEDTNQWIAIN